MDGAKGVDKTSMSLDDIIKMDRVKGTKRVTSRNANYFAKNSLNRAKNNINRRPTSGIFNQNRLGLVNKRNFVKTNIVINKRNNIRSNALPSHINENQSRPLSVPSRSFRRNNLPLNSAPAIQITRTNDQHQTFRRNNNDERSYNRNFNDKVDRRPFNRNFKDTINMSSDSLFKRKPFRDNNRPVSQSNVNNRRTFNTTNGSNRPNVYRESWQHEDRSMPPAARQTNYDRRSFIDSGNDRRNVREYVRPRDNFRPPNPETSRAKPVSHNDKYSGNDLRRGADRESAHRKNDRSQDREYEAMARALIEAHRDSRDNRSHQDRYDTGRGNVYRR